MLLNCVLFYSLEKSQWVFFLFSSFFFISVSFFSQKKISFRKISFKKDLIILSLSLSEESLLFYIFFGKAIREKMIFACLKKQEKNIIFLNVLVFPVSLLIRKYCKIENLETLTSVFARSHTSIEWNVTLKLLEFQGTPSLRQAWWPK